MSRDYTAADVNSDALVYLSSSKLELRQNLRTQIISMPRKHLTVYGQHFIEWHLEHTLQLVPNRGSSNTEKVLMNTLRDEIANGTVSTSHVRIASLFASGEVKNTVLLGLIESFMIAGSSPTSERDGEVFEWRGKLSKMDALKKERLQLASFALKGATDDVKRGLGSFKFTHRPRSSIGNPLVLPGLGVISRPLELRQLMLDLKDA